MIELTGFYPSQYYPETLRLVKYWDEEQEREFVFLTNAMHISALQVADLYKNRWQVELFFKWLKQHLKIKKFWVFLAGLSRRNLLWHLADFANTQ
jgi:IS4 transposase